MSGPGRRVAIAGYSQTPIVRHADAPLGALTAATARAAIADAGLQVSDVDGFVTVPLMPAIGDHVPVDGIDFVTTGWLAQHLGVYPAFLADFSGGGQITGTIALAAQAIASGAAETVVVHRALHNPTGGRYHGTQSREAKGLNQWTTPQGHFGPIVTIALAYQEYLQRYGATREAMAAVVVEARKNGARIPWSYWYDQPLTVDDYLAAPLINDPMGRLDCDIPVDGVAAFVLTSAERAADLPNRPVFVEGTAIGSPPRRRLPMHWPLDDIHEAGRHVVGRILERTGFGAADIDVPQLYDGFSPIVWFWLEALGFCPEGEAHRFVQDGRIDSDAPDGLPILSGGGALGNGRMHGVPQTLECYLQLSGRAGDRQRERATVGIACQGPPHVGGIALYTNQ